MVTYIYIYRKPLSPEVVPAELCRTSTPSAFQALGLDPDGREAFEMPSSSIGVGTLEASPGIQGFNAVSLV